jgi:hypothetical protein
MNRSPRTPETGTPRTESRVVLVTLLVSGLSVLVAAAGVLVAALR